MRILGPVSLSLSSVFSSEEENMEKITRDQDLDIPDDVGPWIRDGVFPVLLIGWFAFLVPLAGASHQGHEGRAGEETHETTGSGHPIPGASFQVFLDTGKEMAEGGGLDQTQADAAIQTVIEAFTFMMEHRTDYPRFDEALKKDALQKVIIEPNVVNQDGKEFPFLVARTK